MAITLPPGVPASLCTWRATATEVTSPPGPIVIRSGGINDRFYATGADTTSEALRLFFLDSTKGAINVDIDGGVPTPAPTAAGFATLIDPATSWSYIVSSTVLVGPTRSVSAGKEVVVQASASGSGFLSFEDSTDGTTWTVQKVAPIQGAETIGVRFTPSNSWRVKYYADTRQATKRMQVWSQLRDPGV